jgi:hypothetical protein
LNEEDLRKLEGELARLRPAPAPRTFLASVLSATRAASRVPPRPAPAPDLFANWLAWLRWLAPVTALLIAGLFVWRSATNSVNSISAGNQGPRESAQAINADDVQIDSRLISTFDAVAVLPSGEPVRFRCNEWLDDVVFRDRSRQVAIEQQLPRLEATPIGFETY